MNRPEVAEWLDHVLALSDADPAATCEEITERSQLLDRSTAAGVVGIPEPVLQELLLNLDAALGAAEAFCDSGDSAGASEEWSAAIEIARVAALRLEEIG